MTHKYNKSQSHIEPNQVTKQEICSMQTKQSQEQAKNMSQTTMVSNI